MIAKQNLILLLFSLILLAVNSQYTSYQSSSSRPNNQYTYYPSYSQASSLIGDWTINSVDTYSTNINASITSNTIKFNYCNSQQYTYSTSGNRISIKAGASTQRLCKMSPPTQDQVRTALTSAATFSTVGNMIVLRDARNKVLVTLTRKFNFGTKPTTPVTPVTVVPIPPVTPTIPTQPSVSIVGIWTATTVKNQPVSFAVTIQSNSIRYRYCNSVNRNYQINGNTINIKSGISTKMACLNQVPNENIVSSAFDDAKTYTLNNGVLTLFDANKNALVTLNSGLPPITGTYEISSINGISTLELNKVVVTISQDSIEYNYCNGKRFSYKLNNNKIEIESGISTLMFCENLSPNESDVDGAFLAAKTFLLDGKILSLYGDDGTTKVSLFKTA